MKAGPRPSFTQGEKATAKYLATYAEVEANSAEVVALQHGPFSHGLAIPAQAEDQNIIGALRGIPSGPTGPVLTVTVINACTGASQNTLDSNLRSLKEIKQHYGTGQALTSSIHVHKHPSGHLVVIDRSTQNPLPPKQGVGLARKIGCDFLLAVAELGALKSPWLHCSDADTRLPSQYFAQASGQAREHATALLYPFRHREDSQSPTTHSFAMDYESSLRYYVLGLRFAESTHDFHTVGSAMAVHANAYAKVRGFPRREAAEDFYLLNKLAKLGSIQQLGGPRIEPSSRASNRVPFGTGAAIEKHLREPQDELKVDHPIVFNYLKAWEATLTACLADPAQSKNLSNSIRRHAQSEPEVDASRLLSALEKSGSILRADRAFKGPASTLNQRLRDSLDSFRTLKFIHALRDEGLAAQGLRKALNEASFIRLHRSADRLSSLEVSEQLEELDYQGAHSEN
ncbi:MAG: hypothetical protein CL917_01850 [Deltaproteobacteria bacterium]|nr:hypothetical protein [Deltaproteobacteria bacterium]